LLGILGCGGAPVEGAVGWGPAVPLGKPEGAGPCAGDFAQP